MLPEPVMRRRTRSFSGVGAIILIHAGAVAVPWIISFLTDSPTSPLLVGGIAVFVAYVLLGLLEARRSSLFITPLSFYFFKSAISLGLSPIHFARRLSLGGPIDFSTAIIPPDYLLAGYLTYLVGSLALHIGIELLRPATPAVAPARDSTESVSQLILPGIWCFSVVTRLAWDALSFLGGLRGLFSSGSLAVICLYALKGRDPRARTPSYYAILAASLAVEFVLNVRSGSKAYIMYSFLPLIWLPLATRQLRPLLVPLGAILVAFYLGIVAPVVMTARTIPKQSGESELTRIVGVYERDDFVKGDDQLSQFLERQFDPTPVGYIHAEVDRFGFRYGETLDYLAFAFVPRFLWPEKPSVTRGAWFTMYLGASSTEEDATTSTGQTAVGELYWNFGIPGVIVGMLIIGLFVGWQWRMAGTSPEADPIRFLIYVSLILSMPDMPEAGTTIVGSIYRIVAFWGLLKLAANFQLLRARPRAGVAV